MKIPADHFVAFLYAQQLNAPRPAARFSRFALVIWWMIRHLG
jgi:hypothetical protein